MTKRNIEELCMPLCEANLGESTQADVKLYYVMGRLDFTFVRRRIQNELFSSYAGGTNRPFQKHK